LRKKKNIRYKNSREKPLNQEIKPFPSENQTGYKKEDVQNQDVLIKDDMPAEVKISSSKKTFINHTDIEDKYNDLNKGSDSYEIPGKGNINQGKSFLEPKKNKKVRQKQIGRFHQKEKETYEDLSKYRDKNIASNPYDMGSRNDKALQKVSAKEQRHKENVATITTDKSKNKLTANRKRYKKILKENHDKEDLSLKERSKKYFKSNFEDKEFTRTKNKKNPLNTKDGVKEKNDNKGEIADNSKSKPKEYSKKANDKFRKQEKKILKLQHKKQLKNKGKDSISSKSAVVVVGAVNRYLESGQEDNAGVSAAHKTTDGIENLARKAHNHGKGRALKRQKRVVRLEKDIEKQGKKLFFKKNMEEFKKNSEYQNTSRLRQFFKRRQYKKQLQKKYKERIKNGLRKSLAKGSKKFAEFIKERSKKIMFLILLVVGTFFMLFQAGSMVMNIGTGTISDTVSTTYLSSEETLRNINQEFSSLEQGLQEEMESVEETHPGYDEYIINGKEKISHNVHELLSYITSRYGVVKEVSEIAGEIQQLFNQMYTLTYDEEVEIRYKTVTSSYIDEAGNEQTESHEEAYEYKKLIVNLEKREMDDIIREVFNSNPNNLAHYEALLSSKGNMELVFGSDNGNLSEIINNPDFSNPGITFDDVTVKALFNEAEKHIGKKYVFGANGPNNFDCSSFVCWSFTHSGVKNMPRTTAWGIYKTYCNPISPSEAKAGDIIFFKNTYNSKSPISHVGIYAGDGMMIHAGNPIRFISINTPYWIEHFYGFGRVK
jgi:nlpC/P60 family protein